MYSIILKVLKTLCLGLFVDRQKKAWDDIYQVVSIDFKEDRELEIRKRKDKANI